MKTISLQKCFDDINKIEFQLLKKDKPTITSSQCLVRVASCGINSIDILGVLGRFKQSLPRILGHEFAGTIVDGSVEHIGKQVWGIYSGSHAEYITMPTNSCFEIPNNLDLLTAGAQPFPFLAAYSILTKASLSAEDLIYFDEHEDAITMAAKQICAWKKWPITNCNEESTVLFDSHEYFHCGINAGLLNELGIAFACKQLQPLRLCETIFSVEEATRAYQYAAENLQRRVILNFAREYC